MHSIWTCNEWTKPVKRLSAPASKRSRVSAHRIVKRWVRKGVPILGILTCAWQHHYKQPSKTTSQASPTSKAPKSTQHASTHPQEASNYQIPLSGRRLRNFRHHVNRNTCRKLNRRQTSLQFICFSIPSISGQNILCPTRRGAACHALIRVCHKGTAELYPL